MQAKLPVDANGHPIQAMRPVSGVNKADGETFINKATADGGHNDTGSCVIRCIATDADATISISEAGGTQGDGVFLPQSIAEYLHVPAGYSVAVVGATVNFSPCI